MTDRTIGVVIPAMNAAEFIDQALASVAMQTRPVDQVVVVDDCSDDDTPKRVACWAQVLPLVILQNSRRLGVPGARHAGIDAMHTELICQLDSDDLFMPYHVAAMCEAYEATPGLVSPRPFTWTGADEFRVARYTKGRLPLPGDQLTQLIAQNYVVIGAMYDRDLYRAVGGYRSLVYGEDWDLWLRMVAAGATISKPKEPSYVYRVHRSSYSEHFSRNEAEAGVLRGLLRFGCLTGHRRSLKISLLQRVGAALSEGDDCEATKVNPESIDPRLIAAADVGALELRQAYVDDDIGWIMSFTSGNSEDDTVVVIDSRSRILLKLRKRSQGYVAEVIEDRLLLRDASSLRDILRDGG